MVAIVEAVESPPESQHSTPFGSRDQMLADLEEAVKAELRPKVLAIFALDGYREYVDRLGRAESHALLTGLTNRLGQAASSAGAWYRPREDEFAVLTDAADPALELLLGRAVAALCESNRSIPVTAAFGSVVVPQETSDPIVALRLADARLSEAQPRRLPRDRRRHPRPGGRTEVTSGHEPSPSAPLEAIRAEIFEASASALRVRRVDQLLAIGGTLTELADAARIVGDGSSGSLQGKPRDPARIPLLLKQLGLELAALRALEGPEIAEAIKLVEDGSPLPSSMSTRVLAALDEISVALAAA